MYSMLALGGRSSRCCRQGIQRWSRLNSLGIFGHILSRLWSWRWWRGFLSRCTHCRLLFGKGVTGIAAAAIPTVVAKTLITYFIN